MSDFAKNFANGIGPENPTFRLVLGTCPTMAITLSMANGIGMGLAATAVLIGSNVLVSMLRKVIPDQVRIPAFVIIIAAFVTVVDKMMAAFVPSLHQVLGIFIPLIVVNCIILARAEAFAYKNTVFNSLADGIGMGLGFTLAITLISSIREILGTGYIAVAKDFGFAGLKVFPTQYAALGAILPTGGFLTFGLMIGLVNWLGMRKGARS